MTVLGSGDKCYRPKTEEVNDEYYDILDKLVNDILTKKIYSLSVGFDYQYITFKGNVKVERKTIHGMKYLQISNEGVSFSMGYQQFTEIVTRRDGTVEMDTQGGGIVIDFGKVKR